ncbi:MAG: sugar phosphate isomerase/epimerase [Ruminococcaceae bacterium]|nr:sugar phosphate isomerase/epimerase [Oscillospiraceae bacterium]
MKLGVCVPLNAEKLFDIKTNIKDAGAQFIEGNHYALSTIDKADFNKIVAFTKEIGLPITNTNCFLGSMNIFDSKELLKEGEEYVKRSFERFSVTDLKHVTFGSGISRASNEARSIEDTKKIFAEFCYNTVSPLAKDYGYTIGIEPLNHNETDVFTTAAETFEFVKKLNLPNVKMIVDYYHFTLENENPLDLINYKGYISHLHIASKNQGRTAPLPEDNEGSSYITFLESVKPAIDNNVDLSIEGAITGPLNLNFDYLKLLLNS